MSLCPARAARRPPFALLSLTGALSWLAVGLFVLWTSPAWAGAAAAKADKVIEIRFVGNRFTRDSVLRRHLTFRVGQPYDPAQVAASRQALMNLGLFSSVEDQVQRTPRGVIVVFRVHEKIYTWGLPLLSRDADGNITYGGQIQSDNLFGLDQTLKLSIKRERLTAGGSQRQQTLDYAAPHVAGSPYDIDTHLNQTLQPRLDVTSGTAQGVYRQRSRSWSLGVSRWLIRQGPGHGWSGSVGVSVSATRYRWLSGTPGLAADRRSAGVSLGVGYTDVNQHAYGYRSGQAYGADLGLGVTRIGRDYPQLSLSGYLRRYRRLTRPYTNFNYRLQGGIAWQSGAVGAAYSLGGSSSLRGYRSGSISGDAFFLANVEYLQPLPGQTRLRGVAFMDVGNAWPLQRIQPWRLESDLGLGLRWNITWLVNVDLRVDCAYALGQRRYQCYFGTHNMF